MKRIMLLIIVTILSINFCFSQQLSKIAEISIDTKELSKILTFQSTQFVFESKQKTDFHYAFSVMDIIEPYIKTIDPKDYHSLIVVFENPQGQCITAAYSEFDKLLTKIPAVLMYSEVKSDVGDSITLTDDNGDIDLAALDEKVAHFTTRSRINLQIVNLPVNEKSRILQNATIIFPKDLNTDRWINDIDVIKIYKVDSERKPPEPEVKVEIEPVKDTKNKKAKKK